MGKNTQERQGFIIDNLRVEEDLAVELEADKNNEKDNEEIES